MHGETLGIVNSHCAHLAPLLRRGRNTRGSCQATRGLEESDPAQSGVKKGI